jgi:predicted DNA binding CopG/RHH family protein
MTTKSFQVRVSPELLDKIARESTRRGLRKGEYVRFILSEALDRSLAGAPARSGEVADARQ